MLMTITELKKGEKKYGENSQDGLWVTGEVPSANGPFKKTLHLTFYHNQSMVDTLLAAGVGAQVDFKMRAKEGPKGKIFYPESVTVTGGTPPQKPSAPAPAPTPKPAFEPPPAAAKEVFQRDFDLNLKDVFNPRMQAVQYGLKSMEILMGHVLNPKKMTPELFNELLVKQTEFILALINGKLVLAPKESDTSDLQKPASVKTPDVPDVN